MSNIVTFAYLKYYFAVTIVITVLATIGYLIVAMYSKKRRLKTVAEQNAGNERTPVSAVLTVGTVVFAVSCFGLTVGLLAGKSMSPVVEPVITGMLTIFGGLTVYWFSRAKSTDRLLAALVLVFISVTVMYGVHVGASDRRDEETENTIIQQQLDNREMLLRVDEYRRKKAVDLLHIINRQKAGITESGDNDGT